VWTGHSVESYHDTRWLAGLWSTQNQVECIMLKAAEHCSSNGSVVNDRLGPQPTVWPSVQAELHEL